MVSFSYGSQIAWRFYFSYVFLEGGVNSIDAYFITNIWSIFVTISYGLEGSLFSKFHLLDC